jgi:GDSL-like Lipase/Acylhydrolase family
MDLTSKTRGQSLKTNIILLIIGSAIGLILVYLFWYFLFKPKAGTTFESLTDLRKSMLVEDTTNTNQDSVALKNLIYPHPNDQIIYDLRPNLNLRFQRAQVRTNSCGMRGPEYAMPKPPNTYRIALIGDSFAFGWGVEEKQTFAAQMEKTLNRYANGTKKYEVLNFGVPGYSTFQEVARFQELALDFSPDAVVVFFVENDYGPPFFIRDMGSSSQILSLQLFMSTGKDQAEKQKHIETLARIDPNKALRKLAKVGEEHGIPVFITINPKKRWVEDRKKLWVLREQKSIQLMNIYDQFMQVMADRKIDPKDLSLAFDPHPSPLKHEILGALMAQYFF